MKKSGLQAFLLLLSLISFIFQSYSQSENFIQSDTLIKFFPDISFAKIVADKLNKKINDIVTVKELANINGDFDVGLDAEVSNLEGIGYLTGIDTFHCYKNEVTEIPAEIGNLVNLKYLDLNKAFALKKIPKEIGQLKNLIKIRISMTEINSLPKEIGDLPKLETLTICCNGLSNIPKEIGHLKALKVLDIHSNNINKLPDEICNLTSLTSLNVSYCKLYNLPENIGDLKELDSLNAFSNDLNYLPKSIIHLNKLKYLNVFDNFKLSESFKTYLPILLKNKN